MVRIYVTGDNHIGKKYDRFPEAKDELIASRFESLRGMVRKAETEDCGLFVITGDLFDNNKSVSVGDVKKVVSILAEFNGTVVVLPGNHDFYTGEESVWRNFEEAMVSAGGNIVLLKESASKTLDIADEHVVLWPALCQAKHSAENNLSWIKKASIDQRVINVGIAHGAIKGITPDQNQEYFLMTESELNAIPVDAWLIGHTHIPFPAALSETEDRIGYKIFNAGTHEQTDFSNNSEGNGFIITIDKEGGEAKVSARKHISGSIRFHDVSVSVSPDSEDSLKNALTEALKDRSDRSVVRVTVNGVITQDEYQRREQIYQDLLGRFLAYEKVDVNLSEEITVDKIRSEYAETSFAAQFLEELVGSDQELQLAYQLLQQCKESK